MVQLSSLPPYMQIIELVCSGIKTQALHAAVELGLPDLVKDGDKSIEELAVATGSNGSALSRLIRVLVCLGVLAEPEPGRVAQTPLSVYLESDHPKTLYHLACMAGGDWQWKALGSLTSSVQTGQPAFDAIYGKSIWRYFAEDDAKAGALFNNAMQSFGSPVDEPIADAYDFGNVNTLVDVGGGTGSFLTTVLSRYPSMKGILFDRLEVIAQATEQITLAGLGDRCQVVSGDFFKRVPEGGDVYFMRQIIKDWPDQECVLILSNCRTAMNSGGSILVAEHVLALGGEDLMGKLVDLQLLSTLLGQEREEAEFRHLIVSAQLELTRIIPTSSAYKILECR